MWGDNDILNFQMGAGLVAGDMASNRDYLGGAGSGGVDASASGRISLTMLSAAIVGVIIFYVATRSRQF